MFPYINKIIDDDVMSVCECGNDVQNVVKTIEARRKENECSCQLELRLKKEYLTYLFKNIIQTIRRVKNQ